MSVSHAGAVQAGRAAVAAVWAHKAAEGRAAAADARSIFQDINNRLGGLASWRLHAATAEVCAQFLLTLHYKLRLKYGGK